MKLTFYGSFIIFLFVFSYSAAFGEDDSQFDKQSQDPVEKFNLNGMNIEIEEPSPEDFNKIPYFALLYEANKNSKLTVRCEEKSTNKITCDFEQISVTKVGKKEILEKKLEQAVKEFEKSMEAFEKFISKERCSSNKAFFDSIKTGKKPQNIDVNEFKSLMAKLKSNPRFRTDVINLAEMSEKLCNDPSRKDIESMIRLMYDKEMRTCAIYTSNWSETFILSANGTQWTSNKGPTGECGLIDIGVFKKDAKDKSALRIWTYESKRIVTNKKGKWAMGLLGCEERENQEFFDWKKAENFLGCDYIEGM